MLDSRKGTPTLYFFDSMRPYVVDPKAALPPRYPPPLQQHQIMCWVAIGVLKSRPNVALTLGPSENSISYLVSPSVDSRQKKYLHAVYSILLLISTNNYVCAITCNNFICHHTVSLNKLFVFVFVFV